MEDSSATVVVADSENDESAVQERVSSALEGASSAGASPVPSSATGVVCPSSDAVPSVVCWADSCPVSSGASPVSAGGTELVEDPD